MGEKTKAPNESRKGKRIWLEEGDPKLWIFRSIGKGHPLSVWKKYLGLKNEGILQSFHDFWDTLVLKPCAILLTRFITLFSL